MSNKKGCQKQESRGGIRPGAGRPSGSRFGYEATASIRLPLCAVDELKSYTFEYCTLRTKIIKSGLSDELASDRLDELGNFWYWLTEKLSEPRKVIDIESYRKYPSVAATSDVFGITEHDYEEVRIGDYLVKNPQRSYVLDVVGDSMIGVGIYDGTFLIVEEYNQSHTDLQGGEIVVVSIGGSFSMIVKTYHRESDGRVFLISANPAHKPIFVGEEHERLIIQGVVKKIVNDARPMALLQRKQYMKLLQNSKIEQ